MTHWDSIRITAGMSAALCLLVVAPGCGGSSSGCKNSGFGGGAGFDPGPPPPPIVGRATGTWQGAANDVLTLNPQQPNYLHLVPAPAGPLTLVITRNGAFTGTLHDAATGEDVAIAGTLKNYDNGDYGLDPKKPAGEIAPGATTTFKGRTYVLSGSFGLESDNRRLTGNLGLGWSELGPGDVLREEQSSSVFELIKQD